MGQRLLDAESGIRRQFWHSVADIGSASNTKQAAKASAMEETQLRVLTLNVWGLKFISPDRPVRLQGIIDHIRQPISGSRGAESKSDIAYDVVCLQELWIYSDFEKVRDGLEEVLPESKFFRRCVPCFSPSALILREFVEHVRVYVKSPRAENNLEVKLLAMPISMIMLPSIFSLASFLFTDRISRRGG